jgi:hypothetical protein
MRYAVDLLRDAYYAFQPELIRVPLASAGFNLTVIGVLFVVFLAVGTALFVRAERNR